MGRRSLEGSFGVEGVGGDSKDGGDIKDGADGIGVTGDGDERT